MVTHHQGGLSSSRWSLFIIRWSLKGGLSSSNWSLFIIKVVSQRWSIIIEVVSLYNQGGLSKVVSHHQGGLLSRWSLIVNGRLSSRWSLIKMVCHHQGRLSSGVPLHHANTRTRHDKTGRDVTKLDKTRQNWARHEAGQDRTV